MAVTINGTTGVTFNDGTVISSTGFNTIGSYCYSYFAWTGSSGNNPGGSSFAAGSGSKQVQLAIWSCNCGYGAWGTNVLSGTWRLMYAVNYAGAQSARGVAVRIA